MHSFEEINKNIVKLIVDENLFDGNNILFLIGDNQTGKSEIAMEVEQMSDIKVMDNFNGRYDELPKNKKTLVVTHRFGNLLPHMKGNETFIVTQRNGLYGIVDADTLSSCGKDCLSWEDDFGKFLNIAVKGVWDDMVEDYFCEYLKTVDLNKRSNQVLEKEIREWIAYHEKNWK